MLLNENLEGLSAKLEHATLSRDPWDHVQLSGFLSKGLAMALGTAFDAVTLDRHEKNQAHKPYRFYNRLLPATFEASDSHWQKIAMHLQGAEYRAALARL